MDDIDRLELIDRYRQLLEISKDLASDLALDSLLRRIGQVSARLCDGQAASILLYDEIKNELYFHASTNLDEPMMRGLIVPVEGSIAGWIVTHRQPVIILDTQSDPRHYKKVGQATNVTTTSILGVPLMTKGKIIGVLEVINKQVGEFTLQDQELLMVLGAQAAVAIENARLFQQSDLVSELVHEVRTPLTSIHTAARLLSRPEVQDEMRTEIVEIIQNEAERLNQLTTAFLDLARLESGRVQIRIERIDLKDLLQESVALMIGKAIEKGLELRLDLPENELWLEADKDKIKQVVLNLLSNAIKYTPPPGKITVSASVEECSVVIQVVDTGEGIPEESLPRIFEKFYRVPGQEDIAQGTGLGLSICKRIVDLHGGTITVESKPYLLAGTKFSIYLPVRTDQKG